ncbi:tryptophan-rich sensory protein TspO [Paracoccus ravus]|uniref:tryptophan-rich sensory protein TspO n=1 Tax=Paracoccus ravus TaxID=2447760 RepID=UPI00106DD3AE|nr:TspO/MBR family protein [Paracoccus ravus]
MLFVTFLIACAAAGATGLSFKPESWYEELIKPPITPPRWVFPVAWTTIYVLISWGAARLAVRPETGMVLALWSAQIALNTLWTPVFFGAHRLDWALGVIVALWVVVAAMTFAAFRHDVFAALLFLIYLGWLTYAGLLNLHIWQDNRDTMV